jgi:hypothetical protein
MAEIQCFHPDVPKFLASVGGRPLDISQIAERIEEARRRRDWSGMATWVKQEGARWTNNANTLVFEVSLDRLSGAACLLFTQNVWMLQPSLFEYLVLDKIDRGIVPIQWDLKIQE